MTRTIATLSVIVLIILLAACSVEVDEPQATVTPVPASSDAISEGQAQSSISPVPAGSEPSWLDLDLTGAIYFIGYVNQEQQLMRLDLFTGEEKTLFKPSPDAWLTDIAVSPSGEVIVMAYSPPSEEGQVQYGFTDLYIMPADGSEPPELLLQGAEDSETFFNVSWPVDDTIYYAHFAPTVDEIGVITYASQIERLSYPEGEAEVLVSNAAWPRVSDDGTRLAYVTEDNALVVADADGSNPVRALEPGQFTAVDAPIFSPDGQTLCFSAVNEGSASLWERLLGIKVAYAHSVPSDWWCMPADSSGPPTRLTNINEIGLYGDFAPDGRHMAFISSSGIRVMAPDGSDLTQLQKIATIGTTQWMP